MAPDISTSDRTISGDKVTLRPIQPSDLDWKTELGNDPEVRAFTTRPIPYTSEHAKSYITNAINGWADGSDHCWVFAPHDHPTDLAGLVRVHVVDRAAGRAELGFLTDPRFRGHGLTTTAVKHALEWCWAHTPLQSIRWQTRVGNWASRRVAWRLGFMIEGRARAYSSQRGAVTDCWIGSLLRGEPLEPRQIWFSEPSLAAGPVFLRQFTESDTARLVEMNRAPAMVSFDDTLPTQYSRVDGQWWVDRGARLAAADGVGVEWAIAAADSDEFCGQVSVRVSSPGIGMVSLSVHPDVRGCGVGLAALQAACRHALRSQTDGGMGLRQVTAFAHPDDAVRVEVFETAGFQLVGRQRGARRLSDGSLNDVLLFDLVSTDLRPIGS